MKNVKQPKLVQGTRHFARLFRTSGLALSWEEWRAVGDSVQSAKTLQDDIFFGKGLNINDEGIMEQVIACYLLDDRAKASLSVILAIAVVVSIIILLRYVVNDFSGAFCGKSDIAAGLVIELGLCWFNAGPVHARIDKYVDMIIGAINFLFYFNQNKRLRLI
jgi:hypothetical protein